MLLHTLRHRLNCLIFAGGCAALSPFAAAQTATLGYDPLINTIAPSVYTFASFTGGSSPAFIVPFQVNSLGSHFSLASVSLLLSGTDSVINGMSVSVLDSLPTSTAGATALISFTNSNSGSPGTASTPLQFAPSATPSLNASTTYYLRIGYNGAGTMNWDSTGSGAASASGGTPALTYITGSISPGSEITYRQLSAGGFSDGYATVGGFSVIANTVSAVPEPAAVAALAGGIALLAGLAVRWRSRVKGAADRQASRSDAA